jgi:hypothetical protein
MSTVSPYASIGKRTFASALIHLLETEYRLLGGRRILALLAEDVAQLVQEFYPDTQQATSGTLIWSCTADEGQKAQPGKRTEEYKTVTVLLPLVTSAEIQAHSTPQTPRGAERATAEARYQQSLVRIVQAAAQQGGLLTLAELSLILNRPYETVRHWARSWEDEHNELLPLKGLKMDQGSRPTHKGQITRLYEQGKEPPDIARETAHSLKSVERYLKDYERVKLLLRDGHDADAISQRLDRGRRVVLEYMAIAREFHPELFAAQTTKA